MNRRFRRTSVLLLPLLLLAACGDDTDDAAAATDDPPAADAPEGRGIVTRNDDGTRTVSSAYGTAVVPEEPERIVSVIGDIDLEAMLALGVTPVGAGTQGGSAESGFAPHLEGLTDGIEPLAWVDGAPAEAIAELEPDLIFVPDADSAELLADIAPVVPRGSWVGGEWKDDFLYVGAVLGLEDEAQELLDEYEAEAADLKGRLAPVVEGLTALSPQTAYDHANVYVDEDDAFSSVVLRELGIEVGPLAAEDHEDGIAVSFEQLERLDAGLLFWQVRQADDGTPDVAGVELVKRSPLFPSLPAVAAGRFFEVPNRPWYFPTILGARQILRDVEEALL